MREDTVSYLASPLLEGLLPSPKAERVECKGVLYYASMDNSRLYCLGGTLF